MATNSVPSASVQAKKAALLDMQKTWPTVRDPKTGQRVTVMPNLTETRVYYLDPAGRSCNCKAGQHGTLCAHRLALIERLNHDALSTWITEIAAHSTAALADGWETIPSDEQASHAAYRARLAAEPTPRRGYQDLFPSDEYDDVLTSAF